MDNQENILNMDYLQDIERYSHTLLTFSSSQTLLDNLVAHMSLESLREDLDFIEFHTILVINPTRFLLSWLRVQLLKMQKIFVHKKRNQVEGAQDFHAKRTASFLL